MTVAARVRGGVGVGVEDGVRRSGGGGGLPAVLQRAGRDGQALQAVRVRVPDMRVVLASADGAGGGGGRQGEVSRVSHDVRRERDQIRRASSGGAAAGGVRQAEGFRLGRVRLVVRARVRVRGAPGAAAARERSQAPDQRARRAAQPRVRGGPHRALLPRGDPATPRSPHTVRQDRQAPDEPPQARGHRRGGPLGRGSRRKPHGKRVRHLRARGGRRAVHPRRRRRDARRQGAPSQPGHHQVLQRVPPTSDVR